MERYNIQVFPRVDPLLASIIYLAWSNAVAWIAQPTCLTEFRYLPHKEERFLFVIYPMICLSASLALVFLSEVFEVTMNAFLGFAFRVFLPYIKSVTKHTQSNRIRAIRKLTTILVFAIFLTLSFSRIFALTIYYRAPLQVYSTLNDELKSANALKDGNGNYSLAYAMNNTVQLIYVLVRNGTDFRVTFFSLKKMPSTYF